MKAEKRAKIEEMKKEGTYLSKKQLAQKKAQDALRAQLIAEGKIQESDNEEDDKDQKNVNQAKRNRKNKKKGKNTQEEEKAEEKDA